MKSLLIILTISLIPIFGFSQEERVKVNHEMIKRFNECSIDSTKTFDYLVSIFREKQEENEPVYFAQFLSIYRKAVYLKPLDGELSFKEEE